MKKDYLLVAVVVLALGLSIAGLFIRRVPGGGLRFTGREGEPMGFEDQWKLQNQGQFQAAPEPFLPDGSHAYNA